MKGDDNDDGGAFELLRAEYGDALYVFCYRIVKDRNLAEDVRQRVFVEAAQQFSTFRHDSSLRTWLFGIAQHRALDACRKRQRELKRYEPEGALDEVAATPVDLDEIIDLVSYTRALNDCLARLPSEAREAVVRHYVDGQSYPEMSQTTSERADTLQHRVARAKVKLRRCIEGKLKRGKT
jgi:RNA polymerase sigma-70 factor, ECF subfamily